MTNEEKIMKFRQLLSNIMENEDKEITNVIYMLPQMFNLSKG